MPEYASLSDEELLRRVQTYDEMAYEELYRRHHAWVLRSVWTAGNEAEDLALEIMFVVYRSACDFRPDASNVRAWIGAIARNLLKSYWKRWYTRSAHESSIPVSKHEEDGTIDADFANQLYRVSEDFDSNELLISGLKLLPRNEGTAIWLSDVVQLSDVEAAEVMGVSEKRIEEYRSRGYKNLCQFLIRSLEPWRKKMPRRDHEMSHKERNARVRRVIQTIPERELPLHRPPRFGLEEKKICAWIEELERRSLEVLRRGDRRGDGRARGND